MLNILNLIIISAAVILPIFSTSIVKATDDPLSSKLWISEVQSGGLQNDTEMPKNEFIELYNPTDVDIDISKWRLEYLSSSHSGGIDPTRVIVEFEGSVMPKGFVLLSYAEYLQDADIYFGEGSSLTSGLLAKSGGHIRLVNELGVVVDQVGWGTARQIDAWPKTSEITPGYSISRIMPEDPLFNIGEIFYAPSQLISPEGGGLVLPEAVEEEQPIIELPIVEAPVSEVSCEGIIINELLPNPAGPDVGNEFIELYNPTNETIQLNGCSLQTSANSKIFELDNIEMEPNSYLALYDSQTGLTLPNAAGGIVWLLSSTEELQAIKYPENLSDDVAWALFGANWQATYTLTPGNENVLMANMPCPAGQERNSVTNRCTAPVLSASVTLAPCKEGQERNPETNRCRNIVTLVSSLVPCKANQERNPETNRCRNIASSSTKLAPCKEGQERNPDTNRCRNISASSDGEVLSEVKDVEAPVVANNTRWWISGIALVSAVGYAGYEWRRDVLNFIARLKSKLSKSPQA